MDRAREKEELLYQLGVLFGPLERLVAEPARYDAQDEARIVARFSAEHPALAQRMAQFCSAEPGHSYEVQRAKFSYAMDSLVGALTHSSEQLAELVPDRLARCKAALAAVPVTASALLPPGSPFSAYAALKALCQGDVATELAWVDPYHGANVFYRYLQTVPAAAAVVLVAAEPRDAASRSDRARWDAFLDVSRAYAQERGSARYRLVVHPAGALHGRWLRLDGRRLYSLDGSAKDAAERQDFTITPADLAAAGSRVQAMLEDGRELFGPAVPVHA